MNEVLFKSLLYDYYNPLLTDKQKEVYEMYYLNDMSLAEISENTGVTSQGVSDMLKRTYKALLKYEDKLKLIENRNNIKLMLENAIDKLDDVGNSASTGPVKSILYRLAEYI